MRQKSILVLSLLLNVVIAVSAGIFLRKSPARPVPRALAEGPAAPTLAPAPQPLEEAVKSTAVEPFRWSQLSSDDDAAYIHNLRAAGCPETTIRDILSASIGHRFDQKREVLREQRAKGALDGTSLTEAIAQSWDEQNDLLARLFGGPASFGSDGAVARAASSVPAKAATSEADSIPFKALSRSGNPAPLAVLEPDPSWGLNDLQLGLWEQVAEQFVESIGGPGQNPKDPAYRQRWEKAQAAADDKFRSALGDELYGRLQLQSRALMEDAFAK